MTTFTPFYNHEDIRARYFDATELYHLLDAMPPLPWNQYADTVANKAIIERHRSLVSTAKKLRDKLHQLTIETAPDISGET